MVYLVEHPALAMLEAGMGKLTDHIQFLKVDISDQALLKTLPEDFLASPWPARLAVTCRLGNYWLD